MTNEEWKRRCATRVLREVRKAGRLRIRELKQRTHYNRGPQGESIGLWYDSLEALAASRKIRLERDEFDRPVFALAQLIESKPITGVATTVASGVASGQVQ